MLPADIATAGWQVVTAWLAQIRNGDPESLLLAWGLTMISTLVLVFYLPKLTVRYRRLCHRYGLRDEPPAKQSSDRSLERSSDRSDVTTAQLKQAETANTTISSSDLWWAFKGVVLLPILEEIVFRGGPVLLTRSVGGSPEVVLLLSIAATVAWAYRRASRLRASSLLPQLLSGSLWLYLWLHGLGYAAIVLHMLTKLTGIVLLLLRRLIRIVHPNLLVAGEEHWITVEPHSESTYGLCKAKTKDGQWVKVTDVTPGETCLVRVATPGLRAMAYPVRGEEAEWAGGPNDR